MTSKYRTTPTNTTGMPKGIPYIVGNEAAERFSFYGMKTILVVFMTQYLMTASGNSDFMTDTQAREWMRFLENMSRSWRSLWSMLPGISV